MDVGRRCRWYVFLWWMSPGGIARILLQHRRLDMTRGGVGFPLAENVKWLSQESLINTSSTKDLRWKYLWCKTTDFHMCMSMCMCVYMRDSRSRTLRFRCLDVKSRWRYRRNENKTHKRFQAVRHKTWNHSTTFKSVRVCSSQGFSPHSVTTENHNWFHYGLSTTSHSFTLHKIPLPVVLNANGTYRVP